LGGATYEKCGDEVYQLLMDLVTKYHSPLHAAEVSYDLIFASKFDADGEALPAVKLHGVAACAKIKVSSLEDRARGVADVKIVIDRHQWVTAQPQTRAAILDHELTHIVLKDEGEVDDVGRPKLKVRSADFVLWGFDTIAERYKEFAPETKAMRRTLDRFKQLSLFPEQV
jgi:hypothetical protein